MVKPTVATAIFQNILHNSSSEANQRYSNNSEYSQQLTDLWEILQQALNQTKTDSSDWNFDLDISWKIDNSEISNTLII